MVLFQYMVFICIITPFVAITVWVYLRCLCFYSIHRVARLLSYLGYNSVKKKQLIIDMSITFNTKCFQCYKMKIDTEAGRMMFIHPKIQNYVVNPDAK